MLALILFLTLTSPVPMVPAPPCLWYSKAERRCRDEDVEVIGPWDPRPGPGEWPYTSYPSPPDFGAYPTEKQP